MTNEPPRSDLARTVANLWRNAWAAKQWLVIASVLIALFVTWQLLQTSPEEAERPRNDYPQSAVNAFIRSCTNAGNARESCTCAIEELRRTFTYDEFRALEDSLAAGGTEAGNAAATINSTIASCAGSP
jgi:hypothetical protein